MDDAARAWTSSSATVAWLTDPANWSGPDGIPTRLAEHLAISAVTLAHRRCVIALPLGLWIGHTDGALGLAVGRGQPRAGRARRSR